MTEIIYQFHDKLSSDIWNGSKIKEEIKKKLIDIAYLWMKEAELPEDIIEDIKKPIDTKINIVDNELE